jgi:hypothetical protein
LRSLIEAVSNKRHVNVTASSGGVLNQALPQAGV